MISSIDRFLEDIKEYEALRKKLESRRLTLDAAITKLDKAKKDKDKKEREDKLRKRVSSGGRAPRPGKMDHKE